MARFGSGRFGKSKFGDGQFYQITKASNLRVKVIDNQITKSSNLKVVILDQQIILSSNLRVKATIQITKASNLIVKVSDNQLTKASNLRIRVINNQIILSSNLNVKVFITDFTPSCTFNIYNFNASSGVHVDEDVYMGSGEGTRTIIGFRSDPYENTYTSDDSHEIIYDVTSNSGTANYYHAPTVNGLAGDHEKLFGMDQKTWNPVWSTISGTIDISGDYATSGSQINISVPNTGTVWSPPTPSGSNVFDVPATHFGTLVVVNQPTDWDENLDHKIHGWCPYQLCIGHAVEVSDMDLVSGTHVNNLVRIYGAINTDYSIDFKVYHASPSKWEWSSGASQIDSGTISGHTTDVWDFINNLVVGMQGSTGTYNYTLNLYSASGSYRFPDDPVRIMDIEFIIP